jgi:hypothetical protein
MEIEHKKTTVRDFHVEPDCENEVVVRTILDWGINQLVQARQEHFAPPDDHVLRYVNSIEESLSARNWFGALFLALAMPDICSALQAPRAPIITRYKSWVGTYLMPHYDPNLFSADDCYYLRCATLHQGIGEHPKMQSRRILFISPPSEQIIFDCAWMEAADGAYMLQLQVDVFCLAMCHGVRQWASDYATDPDIALRAKSLLVVDDSGNAFKAWNSETQNR